MSRQAGQMAGQLASELRRADQWIDNQSVHRTLEKLLLGGVLSSLQKNTNQIAERWRNMYNKPLSAVKYLGQDLGRCTHPGKVLH